MFNKVLAHFLDLCKQVETGEGYHGHMDDAKPKEKRVMQAQVGARHQMLNRWLKNWDILSQVFRHLLFRQRCLPGMRGGGTAHYGENGKPIFQLEYKD